MVVAERQLRPCNCTARLNTLKAKSGMPAHVALQHVQGEVGLVGSLLLQCDLNPVIHAPLCPAEGQQLARHLHATVSQGFGEPRSSRSFSCTCICITNHFLSLTDTATLSLCDFTTMYPCAIFHRSRSSCLAPVVDLICTQTTGPTNLVYSVHTTPLISQHVLPGKHCAAWHNLTPQGPHLEPRTPSLSLQQTVVVCCRTPRCYRIVSSWFLG
jgi:hypothetical protein